MEDDDASLPFIGSSSSSYTTTSSKETSTWTSYIEDFIISETNTKSNENLGSCISSSTGGKEMNMAVVDGDDGVSGGSNLTKMRKFQENLTGLRLKKRIVTRKSVEDEDELDDTASSPTVSCSPKVNLKNMEVESADQKCTITTGDLNTKVCGFSSPLGKKGLCLVPVSILHIYKDK